MINDLNTLYAEKKYKELTALKKALGINKNKEVSQSMILDITKEHNKKEVFLLEYIMEKLKIMPKEIKKQFKLIYENENNEKFNEIYVITEKMFLTDNIFRNFYKEIYAELSLKTSYNRYFFNSLIYEISYKEMRGKSIFSEKNVIMNMYLLQKWIQKYEVMPVIRLSQIEKSIIKLLIQGYIDNEIISFNMINDYSKEEIIDTLEHVLPEKYKMDNITQVLAVYFYKN